MRIEISSSEAKVISLSSFKGQNQKIRNEIIRDRDFISRVLHNGSQKARIIAAKTMKEVKEAVGLKNYYKGWGYYSKKR